MTMTMRMINHDRQQQTNSAVNSMFDDDVVTIMIMMTTETMITIMLSMKKTIKQITHQTAQMCPPFIDHQLLTLSSSLHEYFFSETLFNNFSRMMITVCIFLHLMLVGV